METTEKRVGFDGKVKLCWLHFSWLLAFHNSDACRLVEAPQNDVKFGLQFLKDVPFLIDPGKYMTKEVAVFIGFIYWGITLSKNKVKKEG